MNGFVQEAQCPSLSFEVNNLLFHRLVDVYQGYLNALRPHELGEVASQYESWRAYFSDLYGLDEKGRILFKHFVAYREAIEERFPLEKDLLSLGISLNSKFSADWKKFVKAFERLAREGMTQEQFHEFSTEQPGVCPPLPKSDFGLLAFDCGEAMSSSHV